MRYMVMHKVDANMEAGVPPSQDIIRGMGKLVSDSLKSGLFLDGAGLHRSAQRVRVRCAGGECSISEGPTFAWSWSRDSLRAWARCGRSCCA